ncbi:hypothetical protein GGQ97_000285 [Sphingomonas kaistensis]|uniref:DUF5723 domain-containing protein n=1 Tax=Sphingomonas kaistensis TaxID=298708 RepID=A0A7X6BG00_9SPHN|nr:hypothetical protein [Sphingomonas kaistensis]NJC04492.1 hypothetical protein [Sphingomonas kaistensis]
MITGKHFLRALAGASLLPLFAAAPAHAQNETFLDLQAGLGYSTNPDLRLDGVGSAFGRISAYGYHGWSTERSRSNISAYVENSTYFRRYGNRQLFSVQGNNSTKISETVTAFGSAGFSGDFGAQLSSRFFDAPVNTAPVDPVIPEGSVIVVNPDLAALSQRQYRIFGNGGLSFTLSPRDSLTGTIGAQRAFFKGNAGNLLNYTQLDSTLAWNRQLDERLSAGVRLIASKSDYTLDRSILTYGPQVTANLRLDESLELDGAIGFVRTERDLGPLGESSSTDLAFDASLCRNLEYERMCAAIARRTQSTSIGAAPTSSSLSANYSRRLNARDQIQLAIAATTTDSARELGLGRQNFYSASGSFDRKISLRLSAGVNVAARKFTIGGPDPKADIGGSLFIRNRFGSVR